VRRGGAHDEQSRNGNASQSEAEQFRFHVCSSCFWVCETEKTAVCT
jgi:hypothetical protein